MSDVVIRTFRPDEWCAYRTIRLRALEESPDAFGSTYAESIQFPDDRWVSRLADVSPAHDLPIVALVGDQYAGLAWASIEDEKEGIVHLYQMWVAPEHRGLGLARGLIDMAISWSRACDMNEMVLEVTCGERPARRLYDGLGFTPVGEPKPMRPGSDLMEQTMVLQV